MADIFDNAKLSSSAALFDFFFSIEVKKHELNFTWSKSPYPEYHIIGIVNRTIIYIYIFARIRRIIRLFLLQGNLFGRFLTEYSWDAKNIFMGHKIFMRSGSVYWQTAESLDECLLNSWELFIHLAESLNECLHNSKQLRAWMTNSWELKWMLAELYPENIWIIKMNFLFVHKHAPSCHQCFT